MTSRFWIVGVAAGCAVAAAALARPEGAGLPADPVAGEMTWKPGAGQLVREGAFLRNRRGRLVRGEGAWVYVFDADAQGSAEPPMVMLPCRRLSEMQQSLETQAKSVTFQITGQVFAYRGRNYLLPTYFSIAATERIESEAPPENGAAGSRNPRTSDLLREMTKAPRPAVRGGLAESGSEGSNMVREGATIVSQRGRLLRDGGEVRFVTDTGANMPDKEAAPMVLMPCANLEQLERVAQRGGERGLVTMSGRVFAYEGRNYLLPTFFIEEVDREGNLMPAQ